MLSSADDLTPGLFRQAEFLVRRLVPLTSDFDNLGARFRSVRANGCVNANGNCGRQFQLAPVFDRSEDVSLRISRKKIPNCGAIVVIESDLAVNTRAVKYKRDDRTLAYVFGNVFLGVVRPHLLL